MKILACVLGAALVGCGGNDVASPDLLTQQAGLTPVAPTVGRFGWQSLQTEFKDRNGTTCTGAVTVTVGNQAVCYVAADDSLRCAGSAYTRTFGNQFVATGQTGVDQILIAPDSQICIHKTDGTAMCLGNGNVVKAAADFTPWGSLNNLVAIGTGTFDQLCGIDKTGVIYCSGIEITPTPSVQDGGRTHSSFWVAVTGELRADDATVLRASANRSDCQVTPAGLNCYGMVFGIPGNIVNGNQTRRAGSSALGRTCWLSSDGKVTCSIYQAQDNYTIEPIFTSGSVLALASDMYTDSLCAVYSDGSLACRGTNELGQLGTGDTNPLVAEKIVQPPGSVRVNCH